MSVDEIWERGKDDGQSRTVIKDSEKMGIESLLLFPPPPVDIYRRLSVL